MNLITKLNSGATAARICLYFLLILFVYNPMCAQPNSVLFGFSYKPIFSSSFLRTGTYEYVDRNMIFSVTQTSGYNFGGIIRKNFKKNTAIETGIHMVKRNYDYSLKDSSFYAKNNFSITGYEIPLSFLVFIQLGQQFFMNTALGLSLDLYPSDVYSYDRTNKYYQQFGSRNSFMNTGLIASVGSEYRTIKSGTIYLGLMYHRSLSYTYKNLIEYYPTQDFNRLAAATGIAELQGDYLTVDFRYYFHSDPEKIKKKNKKKK